MNESIGTFSAVSDRTFSFSRQAGLAIAAAIALAAPTFAANTWDGGGANGDWSDLANWDSDTTPVSPTALTFAGVLQTSTNNNLFSAGTTFNGITFSAGSGAFTLSGNAISLGGNVLNSGTNTQTFNLNLAHTGNRTYTTATGGGNITVNGVISGASAQVVSAGTGVLTLTNANTYTGATSMSGGSTIRAADSAIYTLASQSIKSLLGTNVISPGGTTRLELRANGLNDATSQVLTLANSYQVSNGGQTINIDVDRESGTGTGKTIGLNALAIGVPAGGTTTFNITGGNGYAFRANSASLAVNGSSGTALLNPTTANFIIVNGVGNTGTLSTVTKTLNLGGTSTGNTIGGAIANGTTSGNIATTTLIKSNSSVWALNGNSTFTGGTTITGGVLRVSNATVGTSGVGTGNVSIAGGSLGGTGTVGGTADASNISFTAAGGSIAPGASAGKLTVLGNIDFNSAGTASLDIELGGLTAGTLYDQLVVNAVATGDTADGDVALANAALNLSLINGYTLGLGDTFIIIDKQSTGAVSGTFAQGSSVTLGAATLSIDYAGGTGNDVVLTVTAIPEPTTFAALGLAAMGLLRRRR